jgi:hypothetical protein
MYRLSWTEGDGTRSEIGFESIKFLAVSLQNLRETCVVSDIRITWRGYGKKVKEARQ